MLSCMHDDLIKEFENFKIAKSQIVIRFTTTNDTIVDPFTKPFIRDVFHRHVGGLGLCRI